MKLPDSPRQNLLLALMPDENWRRLEAQLEMIKLPLGKVLYEAGKKLDYVYFPTSGMVSLLYVLDSGASAEIAVVGYEGLVGVTVFLGGDSTTSRAVVQGAGMGYRLRAEVMRTEFKRSELMSSLMLRYTQTLITQMSQTAVCNRHHSLDQHLRRWLLRSLDRLPGNELLMTQQLIADMLGVRREGVTEAALKLQAAGIIHYVRGRITVLDRVKLESSTCECYSVVKREYERLIPACP